MNFRLSIALLTLGCVSGTLSAASYSGSTQYARGVSSQHADQVFGSPLESTSNALGPVAVQQATPEPDTWVLAVIGIGLILASTLMRRKTSAAYKRVQRG